MTGSDFLVFYWCLQQNTPKKLHRRCTVEPKQGCSMQCNKDAKVNYVSNQLSKICEIFVKFKVGCCNTSCVFVTLHCEIQLNEERNYFLNIEFVDDY